MERGVLERMRWKDRARMTFGLKARRSGVRIGGRTRWQRKMNDWRWLGALRSDAKVAEASLRDPQEQFAKLQRIDLQLLKRHCNSYHAKMLYL